MVGKFETALFTSLVALALASPGPAAAQALGGDIAAGQKLAEEWCSSCHAVGPKETAAKDNAPSFLAIATMPSTTALSIQAWLQTPHPQMPNWQLTRNQIADIDAYILSLRGETTH